MNDYEVLVAIAEAADQADAEWERWRQGQEDGLMDALYQVRLALARRQGHAPILEGRIGFLQSIDALVAIAETAEQLAQALEEQKPRHARACPAMFDGGCACGAEDALRAKVEALAVWHERKEQR